MVKTKKCRAKQLNQINLNTKCDKKKNVFVKHKYTYHKLYFNKFNKIDQTFLIYNYTNNKDIYRRFD